MLYTFAQSATETASTVAESVKTATGLRPSEFLMGGLAIVLVWSLLKHLGKREAAGNEAISGVTKDHANALRTVTTEFTDTVMTILNKSHQESKERQDACHSQTNKLIEATGAVHEVVRDVKNMTQSMIEGHTKQKELTDAQSKLVHEQRGITHELKLLIEAALVQMSANRDQKNLHLHTHQQAPPPTVIEEDNRT